MERGQLTETYRILKNSKWNGLKQETKTALVDDMAMIRPIAKDFEELLNDAREKMKPEGSLLKYNLNLSLPNLLTMDDEVYSSDTATIPLATSATSTLLGTGSGTTTDNVTIYQFAEVNPVTATGTAASPGYIYRIKILNLYANTSSSFNVVTL